MNGTVKRPTVLDLNEWQDAFEEADEDAREKAKREAEQK